MCILYINNGCIYMREASKDIRDICYKSKLSSKLDEMKELLKYINNNIVSNKSLIPHNYNKYLYIYIYIYIYIIFILIQTFDILNILYV